MPTDTDEPMKSYYIIHYDDDSVYAKDHITLYYRWNKYKEQRGELPKRIEEVSVSADVWRDYFE